MKPRYRWVEHFGSWFLRPSLETAGNWPLKLYPPRRVMNAHQLVDPAFRGLYAIIG